MKHLGDITKINGAAIEPVDCIIGGSPCQDLSVAGKRAGLDGKRSGLFMEQIRIIKEMRAHGTGEFVRPRFMVWENVPGAFSSGGGEDFRAVLEESARIADEDAVIPRPPKGKWSTVGAVVGAGWSIAWRVLDAQFWGVPQRRRRIALVADFGGLTAPEILFERKGVSGNPASSREEGQGFAVNTKRGAGEAIGFSWRDNGRDCLNAVAPTMRAMNSDTSQPCGSGNLAIVQKCYGFKAGQSANGGLGIAEEQAQTLNANMSALEPTIVAMVTSGYQMNVFDDNHAPALRARDYKEPTAVAIDVRNMRETGEIFGTLQAKPNGEQSLNYSGAIALDYAVRRLTPLECERLQGFPDGWTDIGDYIDNGKKKTSSDSARYKSLGNSIALPPWRWVLRRLCSYLPQAVTLGSLFDGIGGFPLIWEEVNGKGSARWAAEIEPFPIAVTKKHFPEDN